MMNRKGIIGTIAGAVSTSTSGGITSSKSAFSNNTEYINSENSGVEIAKSLKHLEHYFCPEEVDNRWRKYFTKSAAFVTILTTALFGSWELSSYLYEDYKKNKMSNRYYEVSQSVYYQENNPQIALELINKALDLNDSFKNRYMKNYIDGMAIVKKLLNLDRPFTKNELDDAHRVIASSLFLKQLDPERVEPYILGGQIYIALEEYDRALKQIQKSIELDSNNSFALVRLSNIYYYKKNFKKAEELLERARNIDPNSKWVSLWTGILFSDGYKDYITARENYDNALKIDPKFELAYYNKAWTYLKEKPRDYAAAKENFQKALKTNPEYKEAYYGLGMVYGYQDKYNLSIEYLNKAISIDNGFLTAYKWRGIVFYELKLDESALKDFSTAISLNPQDPSLYMRRSRILQRQSKLSDAIKDLHFASELDTENKKISYYLGNIYKSEKQYDLALKSYTNAIMLDDRYAEAIMKRAYTYLAMGEHASAIEDANRATHIADYKKERFHFWNADILLQTGYEEKALDALVSSRNVNPKFIPAWLKEAEFRYKLEDGKNALIALNKVFELDPSNKSALEIKEKYKK